MGLSDRERANEGAWAYESGTLHLLQPGRKTLASGTWNGTVILWDLAKREKARLEGHTGTVSSVRFSPNGKTLVSGSLDGRVKVWDVKKEERAGNSAEFRRWAGMAPRDAGKSL